MGIEHAAVLFISTVIFLQPLRQFFDRGSMIVLSLYINHGD